MELNEYQSKATETAIYPDAAKIVYPAIGVADEAGEILGKIKKYVRGDGPIDDDALIAEMGDVLWYLAALASDLQVNLDYVARLNLHKLQSRQERDVLRGNGDNR